MILHLEGELTVDDDDLETRSETFGSSVTCPEHNTPGMFGAVGDHLRMTARTHIPQPTHRPALTSPRQRTLQKKLRYSNGESSGSESRYVRMPDRFAQTGLTSQSPQRRICPMRGRDNLSTTLGELANPSRKRRPNEVASRGVTDDGWTVVQNRKKRRATNSMVDQQRNAQRNHGQNTGKPNNHEKDRQNGYRSEIDRHESDYHNRRNTDGRRERVERYEPSIILSSSSRTSSTTKPVAVKYLKSWGLNFSGNANEDSEEFLEKLKECIECADIPVFDILRALPCVLSNHAARWFRTIKDDVNS